jgi:radical SAM superfamily enzyme YgiQ (UPF0313 family)
MWVELLGVMTLSSCLKRKNHSCDIVVGQKKAIVEKIKKFKPDFLAFSSMTIQHNWVLEITKYLRGEGMTIPIIIGGPHATFFPDIIETPQIDIVCRGEGEEALVDLLDYSDKNLDYSNIRNLWVKREDGICKNELRGTWEDLDTLPFPDRELYAGYGYFKDKPYEIFMATRGCPFACNFCFNHAEKEIYKNKGKFLRSRSVKNLIEEIVSIRKKRNIKM